jgi:hypothetical protein
MARPPADGLRAKAADKAALFDHLVGAGEQCRRHFEAEHLCRAKIDRETRQVLGANLNRSESTGLERGRALAVAAAVGGFGFGPGGGGISGWTL